MSDADINFYFDPLCPFAWMTSKWVRQVTAQRDYTVDWRFISLRMINADVDWRGGSPARSYKYFRLASLSWAGDGRKLAALGKWCRVPSDLGG